MSKNILRRVTDITGVELAPEGRNDVMLAHCATGTTSLPKATSLGEADITCPRGQTSFGEPALPQVAVVVSPLTADKPRFKIDVGKLCKYEDFFYGESIS